MNAPGGGARVARLRRIGLTLTLLGLFAATPIAISWLAGRDLPSSPPEGLAIVSAAAFQSVPYAATATRTATMTAAIAAGAAWVWNTSREGAALSWVSMIANRISTLIAPM